MNTIKRPAPKASHDRAAIFFITAILGLVFLPLLFNPTHILFSGFSDLVVMRSAWQELIRKTVMEHHQLPLWNPHVFCGLPFIGNPGSWAFYPINWLVVLFPISISTNLFLFIHFWIGAIGCYLFLRKGMSFSVWPSTLGVLQAIFGGKLALHILVPGHIGFIPLVWLPWAMWAVDELVKKQSWRASGFLACFLGLLGLSLFTQLAFYSALFLTAYFLFRWISQDRRDQSSPILFISAGIFAAALCAVQLLPVIDLAPDSARVAFADFSFVSVGSFNPSDILGFLRPSTQYVTSWADDTFGCEKSYFLGWMPLLLFPFVLKAKSRRRETLFFLAISIATLVYAFGKHTPLLQMLHSVVPGFRYFRVPSRSLFILQFCIPPLIAIGAESALKGLSKKLLISCISILFLVSWLAFRIVEAGAITPDWTSTIFLGLLYVLALGLFALLPKRFRIFQFCMILSFLAEAGTFLYPFFQTQEFRKVFALESKHIKSLASDFSFQERITDYNRQVFTPILPEYDLVHDSGYDINGFNPMLSARYVRYISKITGKAPYPEVSISQLNTYQDHILLDLLNLKRVVNITQSENSGELRLQVFNRPDAFPRAYLVPKAETVKDANRLLDRLAKKQVDLRKTVLLETPARPTSGAVPFREIIYDAYSPNEIQMTVEIPSSAYLVLSESWHSGWRCWDKVSTQGSKSVELEVIRANYLFRAVYLNKGKHHLIFRFQPISYRIGRVISLIAWLLVGCLFCYRPLQKR